VKTKLVLLRGLPSALVDPKHELVLVEAEAINQLMDMHRDEGEKTTMELKMLKLMVFEEVQTPSPLCSLEYFEE
jgi:hypothetical protein